MNISLHFNTSFRWAPPPPKYYAPKYEIFHTLLKNSTSFILCIFTDKTSEIAPSGGYHHNTVFHIYLISSLKNGMTRGDSYKALWMNNKTSLITNQMCTWKWNQNCRHVLFFNYWNVNRFYNAVKDKFFWYTTSRYTINERGWDVNTVFTKDSVVC